MGATATISYSSLKAASSEANQVAKRCTKYADNLNSLVYNKLNRYNGNYTGNISTAKTKTNAKIAALRNKSQAYTNYATDLSDLRDKCKSTDTTVKSMVSTLTATFKSNHGIRNSKVENTINYYLTGLKNSSAAGRWLSNKKDKVDSVKDYIKQSIEDWWDYEGGKELIKGVALGILDVVIAISSIVTAIGAILTAGTLLAVIAGVAALVAGSIALVNGIVSTNEEFAAYNTTKNGEPATGRRRSKIDSLQDYLRSSFVYGDDGEHYEYNSTLYKIATGIDIVNFVCTAITFVDGVGNLIKNAYKWTTNSFANIKNLRVKDILTKDNISAFTQKVKISFKNGIGDISTAFRSGNFQKIKEFIFDFGDDFINNLKKGYTFKIFAEDSKISSYVQHGFELVKNYASITKTLVSEGISSKSLAIDIGFNTLLLKNLNMTEIVTYNPDKVGVFAYDISAIGFNDIKGLYTDTKGFFSDLGDVLNKLNDKSPLSISVPDITIPDFSRLIHVQIA